MLQVDNVRAIFTYLIALITVVGGGYIIFVSRLQPESSDTVAIVAGFVGLALQFAFGAEIQARTARQAASATLAAGVATSVSNGNSSSPPA